MTTTTCTPARCSPNRPVNYHCSHWWAGGQCCDCSTEERFTMESQTIADLFGIVAEIVAASTKRPDPAETGMKRHHHHKRCKLVAEHEGGCSWPTKMVLCGLNGCVLQRGHVERSQPWHLNGLGQRFSSARKAGMKRTPLRRTPFKRPAPFTPAELTRLDRRTALPSKAAKTKRSTMAHRARAKVERNTHNEETSVIRAAVVERAHGCCEVGGSGCSHIGAEMDHFWTRNRGEEQSVEGCWYLCPVCHVNKTANYPSRLHWLQLWYRHVQRHGYHAEQQRTADAIDAERLAAGLPHAR